MHHCACRDCFEISAASPKVEEWEVYDEESEDYVRTTTVTPPLCWECEEAGCERYPSTELVRGAIEFAGASYVYDCQVPGRYGA